MSSSSSTTRKSLPSYRRLTETTAYYQISRFWDRFMASTGQSYNSKTFRCCFASSLDQLVLFGTIAMWFLVGVIAIVTTKLLATAWQVPPLLLTAQQMVLGSSLLRLLLGFSSHVQPWPSKTSEMLSLPSTTTTISSENSTPERRRYELLSEDCTTETIKSTAATTPTARELVRSTSAAAAAAKQSILSFSNIDLVLTGIFNSLDILASNTAFYASAASFVETVKASEPITTTVVALFWRIDQLRPKEALALLVLISGVFLSTYDNAQTEPNSSSSSTTTAAMDEQEQEAKAALELSIRTALTVMVANLCFAFRALCQKRYRANTDLLQLNDVNLLFRLQQMGAMVLVFPCLLVHGGIIFRATALPTAVKLRYIGLAFVNAASFVVYNGASCYVLSNVSVLHHSGLNCLRRMFVTIVTCVVFGISVSMAGMAGIVLCFAGFIAFSHARAVRTLQPTSISFPPSTSTSSSSSADRSVVPLGGGVGDHRSDNSNASSNLKMQSSQV
ncbi:hypothetical protein ACA910_013534 [Epithemia clementina (nom. ined.)]